MQVLIDDYKYTTGTDGTWISFKVKDIGVAKRMTVAAADMKANAIKLMREYGKRSSDANRYCWTLIEKLSVAIGIPKEDIYRQQILDIPQEPSTVLLKASDVDYEIKNWCANHLGRYAEIVGESREHKGYVWVDRFKGSSEFDKHQMSVLIDNVIYECQQEGIETKTPEQIARMKALWGEPDV
jgi:hypothetical protein